MGKRRTNLSTCGSATGPSTGPSLRPNATSRTTRMQVKIPEDVYPPRKGKPEYSETRNNGLRDQMACPFSRPAGFRAYRKWKVHSRHRHPFPGKTIQPRSPRDRRRGSKLIKALKETGQYDNTSSYSGPIRELLGDRRAFK